MLSLCVVQSYHVTRIERRERVVSNLNALFGSLNMCDYFICFE